ncbi:hypothetical protein BHM03_00006181 [Ensete ventricosum]|nr:hypothetical protein BHM03_00006181 [Ensete ventricosum]
MVRRVRAEAEGAVEKQQGPMRKVRKMAVQRQGGEESPPGNRGGSGRVTAMGAAADRQRQSASVERRGGTEVASDSGKEEKKMVEAAV